MIQIPIKFKEKLSSVPLLNGQITSTVAIFSVIYADNKLYFFPEYTDHGLAHINNVLKAAEEIIDEETINKILTPQDIAVLILSIILHDLGMQLSFDSFMSLIDGKNDDIRVEIFNEKTWKKLWEEFLDEVKKFNGKQLKAIFGNEHYIFRKPNLDDKLSISEADRLLIGEFIRRHHTRIAHEVAIKGLVGKNGEILDFAQDTDKSVKQLAGIIARSHGMEIRDTFKYLKTLSEHEWANPYSINVVFLMVVLRIADYFQFDASRIDKPLLKLKTFSSPISEIEHDKHLSIDFVKVYTKDPETFYVEARPGNTNLFLKLETLFKSIQYELDISWAILGEIYGKEKNERQPKIKYRRIKSNLEKEGSFAKNASYVAEKITFEYDPDLAKLLIAPLYGDNPTFGVRELLQNAIDACKEREIEETKRKNVYEPLIEVSLIKENENTFFLIKDNGKGMTLMELKKYFLKAGSSFRRSIDWHKRYTNEKGESVVMRSGRFGVGVLAAFLLGDEIEVFTKSASDTYAYFFKAKLDMEQLDIKKVTSSILGTSIKIYINDVTQKKLHEFTKIKWFEWYKFKYPTVKYNQYNDVIPVTENLVDYNNIPIYAHEIQSQDFKKVIWYYDDTNCTTCNGILIPNNYKLSNPEVQKPVIHIIDHNAKLNLNLSRESIDGILSFENELIKDIYKDLIAYLLLINPNYRLENNELRKIHKNEIERHASGVNMFHFLYTQNGFFIDNQYFIDLVIRKSNFLKLHIGLESLNDISLNFRSINMSNYLVSFGFANLKGEDSGQALSSSIGIEFGSRIYTTEKIFKLLKNYNKAITDNFNIEDEIKDWVCFNIDSETLKNFKLNDIEKLFPKISYIKEINLKNEDTSSVKNNSPLFSSLLSIYFGENYIIPYDIEERKNMFPKAFEELKPYMMKYLKI